MSDKNILYINSIAIKHKSFMEVNNMFDKDDCGCKENKCTDKIIISVLVVIFAFIIGVIVGATTDLFALLGTAIFVVLAVAIGILIIIRIIIYLTCNKTRC